MRLYHHPYSTNCRKVRLVIETLRTPIDLELVDIMKGANRAPAYLAINPNGKIPALVDGDLTLWESTAIAVHLASKQKTSLWPGGTGRARVLQWLAWSDSHWSRALETVVFERLFKQGMGLGAPDQASVDRGLEALGRLAPVLDAALERSAWVAGDDVTLADFALVGTLMFAEEAELPLARHKHLTRWLDRIRALDAWHATTPPRSG